MNYDRATLRATAVSVKQAHIDKGKEKHSQEVAAYKRDLAKWKNEGKPEALAALQGAVAAVKKDAPISTYDLRQNLSSPPTPPGNGDCCTPATQGLDTLITLLDSISDDKVSSTALSMAGFKDLNRLLRRPC